MAATTTTYLALVKAEYDYAATTDEEISITEDQVLYVLEYTDDEWWKVRVKQAPSEGFSPEDAPTGLVPASYVTPCEPLRQVTALYDYEATSDEEITIKEDGVYDLYETDGDWTLVGARDAKEVGYAPTAYLEDSADAPATNGHTEAPAVPAPPPAPPLPTGAAATTSSTTATPRKTNGVTSDKVLTWSNVTELEGKKKKKGTLGVGNGSLFFASDSDKAPVQKKDLSILKDITTEKSKHIKLYFTNGELLQFTVPKDDMEAITNKIESSREFAQNGGAAAAQQAAAAQEEASDEDTYVPPPPPPPPTAGGGAKAFGFLPPPPRRMVSSDSEDSDDDDDEGDREPPRGNGRSGAAAIPVAPPPPPAPPAPPAAAPQAPRAPVISVAPPAPSAAFSRPSLPAAAPSAPAPSGKKAKAEYDFTASEPEELSLAEGETLYVLDDSAEDWWKVRNERGEEGEVPASYVELLETSSSAGPSAATGPAAVDEDADEEAARRLQEQEIAEARREKERLRLKKLEDEARGIGAFDFQPPPMRKHTASSGGADTAAAARAVAATSARSPSPPPPPPPPPAPPAGAASPPPRAPARQDSQDAVREQRRERHRQRELQRERERASQAQAAVPVEKTKPSPARVRTWVDRTGAFKVDAEFVGLSGAKNEKIRLHKLNGVVIEVPLDKMSQEDIRLVEHLMRKRLASSSGAGEADRRHSHRSDRNRGEREQAGQQQQQAQHRARPPSAIVASGSGKRVTIAPGSGGGRKDQTDWFEWFLNAGCDIDDCERYARNFEKDRIDVDIVGDLEASTLRNLGLREGDIIRVRKYIAKKTGGSNSAPPSATTASSSSQRGPPPPDKDSAPDREQQLHEDEELARKLQEEMNAGRDGSGLFTSASGGVKNTRRGRPQPKTAPSTASFDSIASSLSGVDRSSTPSNERVRSPDTTREASKRPSSTAPASSGFDDDAWTVKPSPSNAKSPSPVLIDTSSSASSTRATPSPAPIVTKDLTGMRAQTASPASMPSSSKESSSAQALTDAYLDSIGLGKRQVTDYGSGTPARQTASPAPAPPAAPPPPQQQQQQQQQQQLQVPQQTGYAPQNQVSPQQTGYYQQQNNGPRAPPAPIPLNQQLLNPLIPTQTGMTGFIPTRNQQQSPMPMMPQQTSFQQPMQTGFPGQSPFGNQFAVPMMQQPQQQYGGMMQSQPTGYPLNQQMSHMSMQPTGMPYQATASPQPQMHIPQAPPPPPMPQQQQQPQQTSNQSSSANDFQPANVFAKMKAGQFAKPESSSQPQQKYDALRPQQTSFGMGGYGQQQMQPQPTGFPQQMQPLQAQPTGFAPGGYINMPQQQQQPNMNMMYPQQTGYPYRPY